MKKHSSFTLIELVFVIIIVGIMAVYAIPKLQRDELQEAARQVVEHIRYTQHLAMREHKFDPRDKAYAGRGTNGCKTLHYGKYFKERWQIRFQQYPAVSSPYSPGNTGYTVYNDKNRCGSIDYTGDYEPAIDPLTKKFLYYYPASTKSNTQVNLELTYNISNITVSCKSSDSSSVSGRIGAIVFDELGRPYSGVSNSITEPYRYKLTSNCNITLVHSSGRQAVITVAPETGYAYISSPF